MLSESMLLGLFHLNLRLCSLAVGRGYCDCNCTLFFAFDNALGADGSNARVGADPRIGGRYARWRQLDLACQFQRFSLLHAVARFRESNFRGAIHHRNLHAGADAIVGDDVDRAASRALRLDLACRGNRRHVSVAAVVSQLLCMGQYRPAGLHPFDARLDGAGLSDNQRHIGGFNGHLLGICGLFVEATCY